MADSIAILEVIAIGYDTTCVACIAGALAIIEGAPIMSGGNIMLAQKHLHWHEPPLPADEATGATAIGVIASAAMPIVVVTAATLVTTCISVVASVIVANDCTVSYTNKLV